MVDIIFYRNSSGGVRLLTCSGHAEFSDEEHGGDIVCAAVSALTGYLGLTVSDVLGWPDSVRGDDGMFELSRPEEGDPQHLKALDLMLEGWIRSVQALEDNYSGWVKVEEIPHSDQEAQ